MQLDDMILHLKAVLVPVRALSQVVRFTKLRADERLNLKCTSLTDHDRYQRLELSLAPFSVTRLELSTATPDSRLTLVYSLHRVD